MNSNELKQRTKKFTKRCLNLCSNLPSNFLGKHISGQLIRASTSVSANYRAACLSQSIQAFASKISIVLEESDECEFWLEMIEDENLIKSTRIEKLKLEAAELTRIFAASRKPHTTGSKVKSRQRILLSNK
jgi:four helix bundle protein